MDVAPWCYKWMDWMDGLDGSPGGVRYRAPYGANNSSLLHTSYLSRTPWTLSVENFLVMWRNLRYRELLHVEKFWMWRILFN